MTALTITPRLAALGLGALAASCAIAACGSSGSGSTAASKSAAASSSTTSTGARSGFTAFRTCLQQHGVRVPSRPPGSGTGTTPGVGGELFGGGRGGFRNLRNNPKLAAAFRACAANLRGRFRVGAGAPRFRLSRTAIERFVACVRKNGYPQMPTPNFSGKGPIFPTNIRTNPKFQAASRTCSRLLVPAGPGAPPGGTSTTASN